MIKKNSSQRPLEIELLYQKLIKTAQEQIAAETNPEKRARWIAALEKMQSAGGGGGAAAGLENFLGLTDTASQQLKSALDQVKSSGLTEEDLNTSVELIKDVGGAGIQQMAKEAQTSSAKDGRSTKKKIKIKRKAVNKYIDNFFKKVSSLKTDEAKLSFIVKSGVFTEDDFIKIGLNEIGKDLIKKGRVQEGEKLIKIAGVGAWLSSALGSGRAMLASTRAGVAGAYATSGLKGALAVGGTAVLKFISRAVIVWDLMKGVAALATALYAWYNMTGDDMKLAGFDNSLIPLFSAEAFKDKVKIMLPTIDKDGNSPEKFGALGMLCELSRIFWTRAGDLLAIILDAVFWWALIPVLGAIGLTGIGLFVVAGAIMLLYGFLDIKSLITKAIGGGTAHGAASQEIINVIAAKAGTGGAATSKPPTPEESKPSEEAPSPPGGVPVESAKEEDRKAKEEADRKAKEEADAKAAAEAKAKEEADRKAAEAAAINTVGLGPAVEKSNVVSIPLSSVSDKPEAAGKYIGRIKFAPVGRPKYAISLDGSNWSAIPNTGGTKPKTPAIAYLNQLGFVFPEDRTKLMESLTALQREARSERQSLTRAERRRARKQARRVRKGKAA